jgi:hypothetical protein
MTETAKSILWGVGIGLSVVLLFLAWLVAVAIDTLRW